LHAAQETRQEVAALRRLTLLVGSVLGAGLIALVLYVRALVRSSRPTPSTVLPHTSAEILLRRAGGFEHSHRLEEALACYEQVLSLDASLTEAYVGKGRVLNQLERYREALDCFEQASGAERPPLSDRER
jgi:tetratricopeptide (TPR) repeat protein